MMILKKLPSLFLPFITLIISSNFLLAQSNVMIQKDSQGKFTLIKDGKPYFIKGANWPTAKTIDALASAGGNSIRTYADEVEWMLPLARKHNMTLMFGLHLERERLGFNYSDEKAVNAQFERIRATVRKYKNEPEILFWAIGNEPELMATNTVALWKEVNRIARMIREEDPKHPIVTVIAGFDERKIKELLEHCPDLDALGVNWYGKAEQWPKNLLKLGWTKPYIHTEFGPIGYWPSDDFLGTTPWGAPFEQTSSEKAALYTENWKNAVLAHPDRCFGSYAFIWTFKQERTYSWFSMFLPTGERTALVDAMQVAWTGKLPANPAPVITTWKAKRIPSIFKPNAKIGIKFVYSANRPTTLTVETVVESSAKSHGGDAEYVPLTMPKTVWKKVEGGIEVIAPNEPGKYRIFALIKTEDNTAATANLPILVE